MAVMGRRCPLEKWEKGNRKGTKKTCQFSHALWMQLFP